MPLDGPGLLKALGPEAGNGLQTVHTTLCRREAGAFQRAAKSGEELLVACTQESRLFLELNAETEGAPGVEERPIRFVNIRETGGWSKDAAGYNLYCIGGEPDTWRCEMIARGIGEDGLVRERGRMMLWG